MIVIPKEIRKKLSVKEGSVLEPSVKCDIIIIRTTDLWSELRRGGKKMRLDVDEAEVELDKAEGS